MYHQTLSPSGSHTILVLLYQTVWQYSDGDPPSMGVECRHGMKNCNFRPISRFISEMTQDNHNNHKFNQLTQRVTSGKK